MVLTIDHYFQAHHHWVHTTVVKTNCNKQIVGIQTFR